MFKTKTKALNSTQLSEQFYAAYRLVKMLLQ